MEERKQELGNYGYAADMRAVSDDGSLDLLSLEYLVDTGACVLGTPDQCVDACKRYEAAGVDLLLCLVNPYKIGHEQVMQTIDLMGKHVIPNFGPDSLDRLEPALGEVVGVDVDDHAGRAAACVGSKRSTSSSSTGCSVTCSTVAPFHPAATAHATASYWKFRRSSGSAASMQPSSVMPLSAACASACCASSAPRGPAARRRGEVCGAEVGLERGCERGEGEVGRVREHHLRGVGVALHVPVHVGSPRGETGRGRVHRAAHQHDGHAAEAAHADGLERREVRVRADRDDRRAPLDALAEQHHRVAGARRAGFDRLGPVALVGRDAARCHARRERHRLAGRDRNVGAARELEHTR